MLCTSKESLECVEIRFKFEKYDILKKINLTNFFDFFAFGVAMVKILFFNF